MIDVGVPLIQTVYGCCESVPIVVLKEAIEDVFDATDVLKASFEVLNKAIDDVLEAIDVLKAMLEVLNIPIEDVLDAVDVLNALS